MALAYARKRRDEISMAQEKYTTTGDMEGNYIELLTSDGEKKYIHKSQLFITDKIPEQLIWEDPENEVVKVWDIVSSNKRRKEYLSPHYIIPSYQRGYRWQELHVRELIEDVKNNYKSYHEELKDTKGTGFDYCLQPIVLKRCEQMDGRQLIATFKVIDGQQRLTTLALIFEALAALEEDYKPSFRIPLSYEARRSEEFLNNIRRYSTQELDLDSLGVDERFMLQNYKFAYESFKALVKPEDNEENWFAFIGDEDSNLEDYTEQRINTLYQMFSKYTDVIWYLITDNEGEDEHTTFENFNTGKIPLTKSELLKALFMNPQNYISNNVTKDVFEVVKTRQIMLGSQWDEMERQLHNADFGIIFLTQLTIRGHIWMRFLICLFTPKNLLALIRMIAYMLIDG